MMDKVQKHNSCTDYKNWLQQLTIFTIDDNDTVVWSLKNLCSPSASAALSFSGFIVTTNLTVVSVLYSL
jgi:hypothetical protein